MDQLLVRHYLSSDRTSNNASFCIHFHYIISQIKLVLYLALQNITTWVQQVDLSFLSLNFLFHYLHWGGWAWINIWSQIIHIYLFSFYLNLNQWFSHRFSFVIFVISSSSATLFTMFICFILKDRLFNQWSQRCSSEVIGISVTLIYHIIYKYFVVVCH